ncbi:hypothetical protein BCR32DRAFT_294382 [Anaeromyces robustus]|uniref:Uncharacterized protein n=1 Tax=Anaeromyces robustus TaxID=1754192 RepID=A0A1Y1X176_9FUNG|nr:hypothetical protein BCR32DRAFT_294382 [Anaeromyces robustus]|eukprot:ORX79523.1 hypothetical protein BCR32DRAFT_294382 [Anaeromyces robustus]
MALYKSLFNSLSDVTNKAQYFNPFFSWIIVTYTYFSIGARGGAIWRYLYIVTTLGFMAICCNAFYTLSEKVVIHNDRDYLYAVKLTWIEGFLWTFNEWGYIYINYVKIRSCIRKLKNKFYTFGMYGLLVYGLIIRVILCSLDYNYRIERYNNGFNDLSDARVNEWNTKKNHAHFAMYFPFGIISFIFIYHIAIELMGENDKYTRNILTILLHSTLTRMLFVSLLFIGFAFIVNFPHVGWSGFLRDLIWRIKGNLGIIFLIDLLLIRVELDDNRINMQEEEIQKINDENSEIKKSILREFKELGIIPNPNSYRKPIRPSSHRYNYNISNDISPLTPAAQVTSVITMSDISYSNNSKNIKYG